MLKQLYIKNFKGFKEALIELKDVNFLVGENSTGKTSLLKLINVLHQRGFWNNNEGFNSGEVELGYFDEIKNQHTDDDFFQIGIENDRLSLFEIKIENILVEFSDNTRIPRIKKIRYRKGGNSTYFAFLDDEKIFYSEKETVKHSFSNWIKHETNTKVSSISLENSSSIAIIISQCGKFDQLNYALRFIDPIDFVLDENYKWLAPIRAKAKRTYESFNTVFSPDGDHVPVMIKNLLNGNKDTDKGKAIIKALEKFGKVSNLFDQIEVENLGKNGTSTFKINILYNGLPMVLPNVGYGVAQALPLLIEILNSQETLISLQQPEVHLHPRAQAVFGDFVYDSCKKDKNRFLIETHSEYMIDRFRQTLSKSRSKTKNPTAQVLYFERRKRGNKITVIPITNDGKYDKALPQSYERFFLNEELNTLHL